MTLCTASNLIQAFSFNSLHSIYRNICVPHRGSTALKRAHVQCMEKSPALKQLIQFIKHTTNKINKSSEHKSQCVPVMRIYTKTRFHTLYEMLWGFYHNLKLIKKYYNRKPMNQDLQWQQFSAHESMFTAYACHYLKILEVCLDL